MYHFCSNIRSNSVGMQSQAQIYLPFKRFSEKSPNMLKICVVMNYLCETIFKTTNIYNEICATCRKNSISQVVNEIQF